MAAEEKVTQEQKEYEHVSTTKTRPYTTEKRGDEVTDRYQVDEQQNKSHSNEAREEREEMQQEEILLQEDDVVHRRQTGQKTYPGSMNTRDQI